MVKQIAQGRRNAVVVLAADDDKRIRSSVQSRQLFEHLRRRAFCVLRVHAIEQRQLKSGRIDDCDLVASSHKLALDEPRSSDALAITTDGPEQDRYLQAHYGSLKRAFDESSHSE
jgi:regulator of extracellular matrix RemA (YlzA/DUF370 family)